MPVPDEIDLQFTTMQEPVPDFIYDELKEYIKASNTYHAQPLFLRTLLAQEHNVPVEWVYLTSGVDDAIRLVTQAFGNNAHIFTPTEYTTFEQFCPLVHTHSSLAGTDYAISARAIESASLIWLANPNNPVGFTEPEAIIELARNNPHAAVVVDEIYGEYEPQLSVLPYIAETLNLIVCKGFSKAYGMAGIRLGYIIAKPELLAKLRIFAPWANVALPSCGMAAIALKHKDYYQGVRDAIITKKQQLTDWLTAKGLQVVPSLINTIVVRLNTSQQARSIVENLANQHIIINSGANEADKVGLPRNFISFVVGTDQQIIRLQAALERTLNQHALHENGSNVA